MAGGRVYSSGTGGNSGSNLSVLFQNQKGAYASEPLDSLFLSGSSPSFLVVDSMLLLTLIGHVYLLLNPCGLFIKTLADERHSLSAPQIVFNIVGFSATVATTILFTMYAKRQLKVLQNEDELLLQ
uniref:Uncharacterized protein n=1 Tax=Quercus lobata TaxID=97700 RepID=A0A7N2N204_QUELO